jgi:hypothetical protein
VTVPVTVGNFAIVMVDGLVEESTQEAVESVICRSLGSAVWKSGPPTYSLPFELAGGASKILKSAREFTNVFGTAADAGDATEVAPTNIPAHSAPITLFVRIDLPLHFDTVFPFQPVLTRRLVGVMR